MRKYQLKTQKKLYSATDNLYLRFLILKKRKNILNELSTLVAMTSIQHWIKMMNDFFIIQL
ncbi:hypothetical protein D7D25_05625 [Proteiniphilum sp. X52]|nr:hypothetical protein D7D25_05625 [Proteiniphilum sp. X52]